MSIVSEAFRRLEEERAQPEAELRCCSQLLDPLLTRKRRHVHVMQSGTLRAMENAIRLLAIENRWPPPRRVRGVLRIDVVVSMSHEKFSYYVALKKGD